MRTAGPNGRPSGLLPPAAILMWNAALTELIEPADITPAEWVALEKAAQAARDAVTALDNDQE